MKKLIYISVACLLGLGAASCESNIDLQPKAQVGETEYFKTEKDFELFTNDFYELLQNFSGGDIFEEQTDLKVNQTLSNMIKGGTNREVPASGNGWTWTKLRAINTCLEKLENYPEGAIKNKYTGICLFFRTFFYARMVKNFGDVPWYDHQLFSDDVDELYKPRDSRELVTAHMVEDIDRAIELLPTRAEEKGIPYRVTAGAALALKSQFCLFEGTFRKYHRISLEGHDYRYYLEQCVDAAEKLMSGKYGTYKLYSTGKPEEDYMMLFAKMDSDKDEVILSVNYDQSLTLRHNANAHTLVATQGQPGYTRKFVCSYLMRDGSRFTDQPNWKTMTFAEEMKNRDPRLSQSVRGLGYHRINDTEILGPDLEATKTGYQPIKFVTQRYNGDYEYDRNNYSCNDLPEYRYAMVLLNYAEAKAELETLTQTDLDKSINLIRKRVGMPDMNLAAVNANPDPYLLSPETGFFGITGANAGVIAEIRRERNIEMTQEGYHWDDLFRWKCGKMVDQDITGMYFPGPGEYDLTGDGVADVVLYTAQQGKPSNLADGVKSYQIGKDLILTGDDSGYLNYHVNQLRQGWNEERDYLRPIPRNERSLNKNLVQNPGWSDGLSF